MLKTCLFLRGFEGVAAAVSSALLSGGGEAAAVVGQSRADTMAFYSLVSSSP